MRLIPSFVAMAVKLTYDLMPMGRWPSSFLITIEDRSRMLRAYQIIGMILSAASVNSLFGVTAYAQATCEQEQLRRSADRYCVGRILANIEIAYQSGITKDSSDNLQKDRLLMAGCDRTGKLLLQAERIGNEIFREAQTNQLPFKTATDLTDQCLLRLKNSSAF
jgi:hypothetical protein